MKKLVKNNATYNDKPEGTRLNYYIVKDLFLFPSSRFSKRDLLELTAFAEHAHVIGDLSPLS